MEILFAVNSAATVHGKTESGFCEIGTGKNCFLILVLEFTFPVLFAGFGVHYYCRGIAEREHWIDGLVFKLPLLLLLKCQIQTKQVGEGRIFC